MMRPHEAGAVLNTACLAFGPGQNRVTLSGLKSRCTRPEHRNARRHGLQLEPWKQAVRDAEVSVKLARKWLVRV
jgi:hypothetical protein